MNNKLLMLRIYYCFSLFLVILLIFVCEYGVLQFEVFSDAWSQYIFNVTGVMLTLILLPLSLKLLSFKKVYKKIKGNTPEAIYNYFLWSQIRITVLAFLMWVNMFFYYTTLTSVGLGCAIMAFIALMFCWPSAQKMKYETGYSDTDDKTNE